MLQHPVFSDRQLKIDQVKQLLQSNSVLTQLWTSEKITNACKPELLMHFKEATAANFFPETDAALQTQLGSWAHGWLVEALYRVGDQRQSMPFRKAALQQATVADLRQHWFAASACNAHERMKNEVKCQENVTTAKQAVQDGSVNEQRAAFIASETKAKQVGKDRAEFVGVAAFLSAQGKEHGFDVFRGFILTRSWMRQPGVTEPIRREDGSVVWYRHKPGCGAGK